MSLPSIFDISSLCAIIEINSRQNTLNNTTTNSLTNNTKNNAVSIYEHREQLAANLVDEESITIFIKFAKNIKN